jgi:PAS domain S-box-containing protein/diguanylate cyclase (GGDEF)-like protein
MNKIVKDNGSGFLEYMWKYPNGDKEEKKISYVKSLGIYDWIVGSGFYFRVQNSAVQQEKEILQKDLSNKLLQIFVLLGIVFTLSMLVAFYVSKRIRKIEYDRKNHLNMLEQYKIVLDESAIVSKTDKDGFITYVNRKFEDICGYKKSELLGKSHNILRHKSMPREVFNEMWKKISKGIIWSGVIKNVKKDGNSYYINTTVIPVKNENGEIVEHISSSSDITRLITTNDMLENFTQTDGLTGLGSRVKLLNDLKNSTNNTLAIIDILKFTEVNDMYGQKVGDKIIKEVANEIFEFSKSIYSMKAYRLHADVFAVFCDANIPDKFIVKIDNFVKYLKSYTFDKDGINTNFDFTAGISSGDDEVLACADMALKNAKRNHLSIAVYNKENTLLDEYKNNEKWMKKITKALKEDRIVPYFQPIYSYDKNHIKKYEALMRLVDEDGSIVSPFHFLDVIKQTSIYPKVTQAMIRKTVDIFRYQSDVSFSINITLEDLLNKETMQYFYSVVSDADIFDRLIIEIVESEELMNFETVGEILGDFKVRGAKIAIDDFGTGYSNYNYLRKLDVDFIKIDGSIIKNITDAKTKEIVSTILNFAKKSGMQTIAEFVSSKEIDELTKELGVDYAQGYFRGKPSPSTEIL